MADNSRIKTGYDIELLLGSNYFQNIMSKIYDSGEIPSEIEINENLSLQLGRPSSFQLHEDTGAGNFDIIVPISLVVNGIPSISHDATISLRITITKNSISFKYTLLDSATINLIQNVEASLGQPGLLGIVHNHLNQALDKKVDFNLMRDKINLRKFDVSFVKGSDGYQDALGLFINIRFLPQLSFMERGDLNKRTSFLPHNRSFAVGVGKDTFKRYETVAWHKLPEAEIPEIRIYGIVIPAHNFKPIINGDKIIGKITSLKVTLKRGFINIKVKGVVWIDWWPDADVNIIFRITPSVQNGIISAESKLHSFDVDTGLFADFLAFLIGYILGGLVGGMFTVALLEGIEYAVECKYDDKAEIDPESFDSALAAFPYKIEWDSKGDIDPFYSIHYSVTNHVDELKVDKNGLSYSGHGSATYKYVPDDTVTIIDKARDSGPQSWNGLLSLKYRTQSYGDIILPIQEILQRLSNHQLAQVDLRITNIHRIRTVVKDVRYNTGLELHVNEATALQDEGALRPVRSVLVHAYQKQDGTQVKAHYRAYPGPELDFEERPEFTPSN